MENEEEFDGVFKFSNASKEDFKAVWNNVEYTFLAETRSPMIIPNEPAENIQTIRKRFALKYAQREFDKSAQGKAIYKEGTKHFSPATYDPRLLEPYIQQCLSPLPMVAAKVTKIPKKKVSTIEEGTAVIGDKENTGALGSADGPFKDFVPQEFGKMEG